MLQVTESEILNALDEANPWWQADAAVPYADLKHRAYLPSFLALVEQREVRRAVLLLGQRRIGKTVMVHHAIGELLAKGVPATHILYCSTEAPVFVGMPLDKLVGLFERRFTRQDSSAPLYVFLDEIQYLNEWERHLKVLVDTKPNIHFIATGSATAALRHKSMESGAGRITEFYLPPLTFGEYLDFKNQSDNSSSKNIEYTNITALNREFVDWLNYGGFPEAVFSQPVREQPTRFIKQDILDKVLLRDLPSLYGVANVQELHRFFAMLAYNTGQEVSLDSLAKGANINKVTLNKYLEYLEAAFLIQRSYRLDQDARHFKRVTAFKVYLTNPSLRAALYSNLPEDSKHMGALVETGVAMHLQPRDQSANLHYARWDTGEVDFVQLTPDQSRVAAAVEVKWSDHAVDSKNGLKALTSLVRGKKIMTLPIMTTRSIRGTREAHGQKIMYVPAAFLCLRSSRLDMESLRLGSDLQQATDVFI
ncbi:MAG: ATP-binding protein [Pseudohongiellaceae bacterium]